MLSNFWLFSLLIYLAIGVYAVEWMWAKMERIRQVDEERDSMFPAFRRTDAKHWNKWMFYPLGVTAMPLRIVMGLSILATAGIFSWFIRIGHDDDKPLTGWRKRAIKA